MGRVIDPGNGGGVARTRRSFGHFALAASRMKPQIGLCTRKRGKRGGDFVREDTSLFFVRVWVIG